MKEHKYKVGQQLRLHATKSSSIGLKAHDGELVTIKALWPHARFYELEELDDLWQEQCFIEP